MKLLQLISSDFKMSIVDKFYTFKYANYALYDEIFSLSFLKKNVYNRNLNTGLRKPQRCCFILLIKPASNVLFHFTDV